VTAKSYGNLPDKDLKKMAEQKKSKLKEAFVATKKTTGTIPSKTDRNVSDKN
jgi:hypothetical protein